jgi:hypothetical protein
VLLGGGFDGSALGHGLLGGQRVRSQHPWIFLVSRTPGDDAPRRNRSDEVVSDWLFDPNRRVEEELARGVPLSPAWLTCF